MKFRFNLWKNEGLGTVIVQRGRKQKIAAHTVDLATLEELLLLMIRGVLKKLGFKLDLRRWSGEEMAWAGADRNQSYLMCPEDVAGGVPQIQLWVDPDRRENLARDWNKNKEIQLELLGGIYFAPDGVTTSQPNWQELIARLTEADHHKRLKCKFKTPPREVAQTRERVTPSLLNAVGEALRVLDATGLLSEFVDLRDAYDEALEEKKKLEASGVPWCKACNSYHHVDNPGCFRLNPQRPEFDEAYAAEFCVRNGQQSTVPELPTQVELRVIGSDYWFDVAKDGSILQVGGESIEDGRAAEIVRFDVNEYRSIYPNYKQVDILLIGYWYKESDGSEHYEVPVQEYRQAVDTELQPRFASPIHKAEIAKVTTATQTTAEVVEQLQPFFDNTEQATQTGYQP